MTRDDRDRADALDRHWDAVQRGETPPDPADLDALTTAMIGHLNLRRYSAGPSAEQRAARARVLASVGQAPAATPVAVRGASPNWGRHPLQMAALLTVMIFGVLALVALNQQDDPERKSIPAATAADPVTGILTDNTLLSVLLPAGALPANRGVPVTAGLTLFTIPVGVRSTWEPTCCSGVLVEHVVEGEYSVRAESGIQVVRATGATEQIAAGNEATLGAGDSLISRNETVVEAWNSGTAPLLLLNWVHISHPGLVHLGHGLAGWISVEADLRQNVQTWQDPVWLTIRRVSIQEGGVIGANPRSLLFALSYSDNRTDMVVRQMPKGTYRVISDPGSVVDAFVLTVEPLSPAGAPPAAASLATPVD
jgi:hypothetical protein